MFARIAHTFRIIKLALTRYPMMLASALLFLFAVHGLIDQAYGEQFKMTKIAFTGSLGISLFFGMSMLGQRAGRVWYWTGNLLTFAFLLTFYFVILPAEEKHFTEQYIYILVPVYILSHLLVAFSPFLAKSRSADGATPPSADKQRFWQYNKTLFVNLFLTAVFTVVLAGGTQLALLAMNHLFNLGWQEELYWRVFLSIVIFGSTFIFTLFHIDGLAEMEAPAPYPAIIQFFTQFILIPLLLLYAGILYIYGIKILLAWELPRGWVSYLVLAYGVLGILALLLVEPLLEEGSKKAWVGWFRRLFYYSMLPLLVLLFAAIGTRIGTYGFTEARYYVLLLAFWLTFISVYFITASRPALRVIPISLFIAGLIALILPYGNALSVGIRSQKREILALLKENELLSADGMIDTRKPVPSQVVDELQDKYVYLFQRRSADTIRAMLSTESQAAIDSYGRGFRKVFEEIIYTRQSYVQSRIVIKRESGAYDIAEFSHLATIEYQNEIQFLIGIDSLLVRKILHGDNPEFTLTVNGDTLNLMPLVESWAERFVGGSENQTVDEIAIPFAHGGYEGMLRLNQLDILGDSTELRYFFERADFLFQNK